MEVKISRDRAHMRTPGIGRLDTACLVLGGFVAASAREMGLSFAKALCLGLVDYIAKKQNPLLTGAPQQPRERVGADSFDRFRHNAGYDTHYPQTTRTTETFGF